MSPQNYARFNGSNIYSSNSIHSDRADLADKFGLLMGWFVNKVFTISGLRFFFTRRVFKRGVPADQLSLFSE